MTVQEALARWNAGEAIWSISMGGLGPDFENTCQRIMFGILSTGGDIDAGYSAANVSGASAGMVYLAAGVARAFLSDDSWAITLSKVEKDRRILVTKNWPGPPTPTKGMGDD